MNDKDTEHIGEEQESLLDSTFKEMSEAVSALMKLSIKEE